MKRGHGPQARKVEELAPRIGVIIPTFRRDAALRGTLDLLAAQTRPPDEVLVVDNAAEQSCREVCESVASASPFVLDYRANSENGGPAGATAIGMQHFLERFDESDWVVRGDDDTPQVGSKRFEQILEACHEAGQRFEHVGAVGTSGARFDPRRARLYKPAVQPGLVPVDYLATNYYPFFSVRAIRQVGVFRSELFFGHDEVEYGLRLRRAGFSVLRLDGPQDERIHTSPSTQLPQPTWRRFYSVRNQIVIAREFGSRTSTCRVVAIAIGKPLLNCLWSPRLASKHLKLNLAATRDAMLGRLGRTIEPRIVSGELDARY